jgi:hypothetical protein
LGILLAVDAGVALMERYFGNWAERRFSWKLRVPNFLKIGFAIVVLFVAQGRAYFDSQTDLLQAAKDNDGLHIAINEMGDRIIKQDDEIRKLKQSARPAEVSPPHAPKQETPVINPDCDQDQPRSKYSQMFPQFTALVAFDCARKIKDLIEDCGFEVATLRHTFDEREKNQPDQLQQIENGYRNQVFMIEKNCVRRYTTKYKDNAIIVRDFIVNQQLHTGGMGDGSEYVSVSTLEQLKNVTANLEALGRYVSEGHP